MTDRRSMSYRSGGSLADRHTPVLADHQLANGLRVAGALRRFLLSGERSDAHEPLWLRARVGELIEDLALTKPG